MLRNGLSTFVVVLAVGAILSPAEGAAQLGGLGDRLRGTVEREVADQINDLVRDAVRCAMDDTRCAEEARANGQTPVFEDEDGDIVLDADGKPITDAEAARQSVEAPGEGFWRNYDFVPGSEVLYVLDLTDEPVGRLPVRQIEFVSGNMEIVERDGDKVLEFSSASTFRVPLPRELPDDFTLEFEFQAAFPNMGMTVLTRTHDSSNLGNYPYHYLDLYRSSGIARARAQVSNLDPIRGIDERLVPFKLQVDGEPGVPDYAILYAGTDRAAQIPNAQFGRADHIEFRVNANNDRRAYLRNIVVAVHGDPLHDALMATGEYTTRGILFDVNSDRLRPESTPTLEELASMLERNPELAVEIEGHTDSDGEEAANLALSQRRAEAVTSYLTNRGISDARLTAIGKGEAEPVADNGTGVGKQQNRRSVIRVREG
ncbi:MAG: OmpA family protein [Gemmatimonadota bacterium]